MTGTFVGTEATGTSSTVSDNSSTGVLITNGSQDANIGGTGPNERNLISGLNFGIAAAGQNNVYVNNLIGMDSTGQAVVPNATAGLATSGTNDEVGQPVPGGRNVIAGSGLDGVHVSGTGISVRSNSIGTNSLGTLDIGNAGDGINAAPTASSLTIGGPGEADRNLILGNDGAGIFLSGTHAAEVTNNFIGVGAHGATDLGNGQWLRHPAGRCG